MKIKSVVVSKRRKTLQISTQKGDFELPFSKLSPKPSARDNLDKAYVDPELASRAVTYRLLSGKEGAVHLDAFLDYNRDPDLLRQVTLHKLTIEAVRLLKISGLSKHEVIRRLKTSPSQLYRLLDPTNVKKSIDEMLRLLSVLGYRLDVRVVKNASATTL